MPGAVGREAGANLLDGANNNPGAWPGLCAVAGVPYRRSQVWLLQMKAMQPETSSLRPPSINCILEL